MEKYILEMRKDRKVMKGLQKMIAILGVMALVLTGCSQGKSMEKMEDKDSMSMEQKDDMKEDSMKDGAMKDDKMKQDSMKDGAMKDDKMKQDSMKDGAMHEGSMGDKKMAKGEKMNKGEAAPDFSLKDAGGNTYTLSEQGGKKVYVKFWASWCSICLAGLEELNTLAGEDNDFEIVTVVAPNKSGEKSKEEFVKWFDTLGYSNIKVLFDETGETMNSYMVRAYPTSAIVGTDGVLVSLAPGHLSSEQIKKAFEQVK